MAASVRVRSAVKQLLKNCPRTLCKRYHDTYTCQSHSLLNLQQSFRCAVRQYCAISREHCNIGTIGHVDHGKTTLTAAITKVLSSLDTETKFVKFDDIDRAQEEKRRGITINATHVNYKTAKRHYAHTDCPGHIDFIKNMITGTSQMDGAILVVAATDGTMPQTREHLLLARQIGLDRVVVFINKADAADEEILELVELEIRDLVQEFGFNAEETPVICGSALKALNGEDTEIGEKSVIKLMEAVDNYIQVPQRDYTAPFNMPVESSVHIAGRGTVAIGTVRQGTIKKSDDVHLLGYGKCIKTNVPDLHIFNNPVLSAKAGENVGVLLKGVKTDVVENGMIVCAPNSSFQTNYVEAQIYMLTREEGGRHKPITDHYVQMVYSTVWSVSAMLELPDTLPMIMPGETVKCNILLRKPMVFTEGQKFNIRENQITTVSGIITRVLPHSALEVKGFNTVRMKPVHIESNQTAVTSRRSKGKKK